MKKTLSATFSGMSVAAVGFLIAAPFADSPWACTILGVLFLALDFRVKVLREPLSYEDFIP